jgi:1-pyrroline-5-carboxylate dehydrogenase
MHAAWAKAGLPAALARYASRRQLSDLSIGPVLSWTTEALLGHTRRLLAIPGARLLFGGKPLAGHTIPACYGAIEPTAVFVPLAAMMADPAAFAAATTEVFGPFQARARASAVPL